MDLDEAKRLFHEGAIIIMLDAPTNFKVGIDGVFWTVGPKFRGIKMIPLGLHFISYHLLGQGDEAGALTGFLHFFQRKEIIAMRWNSHSEQMQFLEDEEELDRFRANLLDLDRSLGPYPLDRPEIFRFQRWSTHITPELLERVLPKRHHIITPMAASYHEGGPLTLEDLHFSVIPTDKEIARLHGPAKILDKSHILHQLQPNDLIGELELSFILLLLGHNFEGFEQWRSIVDLLCHCPLHVHHQPAFYLGFMEIMTFQLRECPADFFDSTVASDNRLCQWLQILVDDCLTSENEELVKRSRIFANFIQDRFGWDLLDDLETGEDAPTIV
jgi:A1 cistron-splicing factor AAR2